MAKSCLNQVNQVYESLLNQQSAKVFVMAQPWASNSLPPSKRRASGAALEVSATSRPGSSDMNNHRCSRMALF